MAHVVSYRTQSPPPGVRLACEVEAKTDPASARAHAKTLEEDARSKGFGLIARKALALTP
jgi:hypothetical protein